MGNFDFINYVIVRAYRYSLIFCYAVVIAGTVDCHCAEWLSIVIDELMITAP